MKIFLDPLDKERVEKKIDAMAQIYSKLTTHKISIHFSRPNSFQKKVLDAKKQWATSGIISSAFIAEVKFARLFSLSNTNPLSNIDLYLILHQNSMKS